MKYKIEELKVVDLEASATNPRKRFDPEKLNELAASIAEQGVLSPLLVRPAGVGRLHEIVAGERRWRAAKLAGLGVVPCIVREMSDGEVLEAQLIENLQRHDLEPMEEARGFQSMMDLKNADGSAIYTAESIAVKIGKSAWQVHRRLKLLNLPKAGQTALELEQLEVGTAEMIARIPTERMREKALKEVLEPKGYDRPLTSRETKALIERRYMRTLQGAGFDPEDASLHPEGLVCSKCPHRAGNCPDVEGVRADTCLNTMCFVKKAELAHALWKERHATNGKRALSPAENQKNVADDHLVAWASNLVPLDEPPAEHLLNAAAHGKKLPTWRQLIDGRGAEILVARKSDDSALECVEREKAMAAARLNGHEIFKLSNKEERQAFDVDLKQAAAKLKARRALKLRIMEAVQSSAGSDPDVWIRELCALEIAAGVDVSEMLAARKLTSPPKLLAAVRAAKGSALLGFAAQIVIADCGFNHGAELTKAGGRLLKLIGVDPKKLEKEAAVAKKTKAKFAEVLALHKKRKRA